MRGSNASAVPRPTPAAGAVLVSAAALLAFGLARAELAAAAWGAVVLAACALAWLAALASSLRGLPPPCVVFPREAQTGAPLSFRFLSARPAARRRLPRLGLRRYRIDLRAADGRRFFASFDPEGPEPFPSAAAPERGAYAAAADEVLACDPLGLFVSRRPLAAEDGPRLLVRPAFVDGPGSGLPRSGGTERREEATHDRTDDLTDNRAYVPGDDPRRLNWKLYARYGELFVRQGEMEPPPRARLAVLVDAAYDPAVLGLEAARAALDAACSRALALVADLSAAGFDVAFGCGACGLRSGSPRDAADAFAFPAALPLAEAPDLPPLGADDRSAVVLALPRGPGAQDGPLERWLRAAPGLSADVDFIAPPGAEEAARACAAGFAGPAGHRRGVRARAVPL